MRGGKSILQAVCAAGILRHVAADAANALRRWVGRIEVAVRGHGFRNVRIDDAGLDDNALVGDIDFQDAIHAGEADDDSALRWQRAAAQSGPRSTRDKRNAVLGADANDGLDLLGAARKHNGVRHGAEVGQAIALIGLELVRLGNQAARLTHVSRVYGISQSIEDGPIKHKRS